MQMKEGMSGVEKWPSLGCCSMLTVEKSYFNPLCNPCFLSLVETFPSTTSKERELPLLMPRRFQRNKGLSIWWVQSWSEEISDMSQEYIPLVLLTTRRTPVVGQSCWNEAPPSRDDPSEQITVPSWKVGRFIIPCSPMGLNLGSRL